MIHIKNNQCPICLNENLKWNLNIKKSDMHMFKCGHGTCKECYNTLISTSEFSCPCCRATSQAYTTGFNSSEINQWNTFAEWYQEYDIFINKLFNSQFVITDGGGVVEECSIIGIPTLVWRNEHLDQNHIFENSQNLFLCNYQEKDVNYFLKNYKKFKTDFKKK